MIRERDEALRRLVKSYLHAISVIKKDKTVMAQSVMSESRVKGDLEKQFDTDDKKAHRCFCRALGNEMGEKTLRKYGRP